MHELSFNNSPFYARMKTKIDLYLAFASSTSAPGILFASFKWKFNGFFIINLPFFSLVRGDVLVSKKILGSQLL